MVVRNSILHLLSFVSKCCGKRVPLTAYAAELELGTYLVLLASTTGDVKWRVMEKPVREMQLLSMDRETKGDTK